MKHKTKKMRERNQKMKGGSDVSKTSELKEKRETPKKSKKQK
ncbi:hypothetical protein [uncultured Anoxybacillus sp.]|nr:hypothetical protein [uncultured Anoxybacillus sp.]